MQSSGSSQTLSKSQSHWLQVWYGSWRLQEPLQTRLPALQA